MADDTLTAHCPVCNQRQMQRHCKSKGAICTWAHCKNKACDAVIDFKGRIGNALREGVRIRVHFLNDKWVERPNGLR